MTPPDDFKIEVLSLEGATVVAPSGEIDVATVGSLRERMLAAEGERPVLVLDLREVGFMDTSGLQLVFETERRSSEHGFRFALVRGPRRLQRLFEIAGLEDRLWTVDHPDEAVAGGA